MTRISAALAGPPRIPRLDAYPTGTVLRRAAADPRPRLSVVVPSYDTAAWVGAAVQSLLAQSVRELEVIVVDDGSHDDSVQRLLAISDSRLTVVRQQNRGLAGARNTGILQARAHFIGFCDSDDLWHPEKAARHLARMEADPSIGVTFSFSAYLDDTGVPTGQLLTTACAEPDARDLARRNHLGNGSSMIVRRECFERVGLFDESLRGAVDWEMWVRIAACTPLRIVRIAEPLTGYRNRAGSLSVSYDHFLRQVGFATQRFHDYVPGFTRAMARRGNAEALRIASRKSFEAGDIRASRRFLIQALRRCPSLFLRDPRALAMVGIHLSSALLPARARQLPYRAAQRLGRPFHRAALAPNGVGPWSGSA